MNITKFKEVVSEFDQAGRDLKKMRIELEKIGFKVIVTPDKDNDSCELKIDGIYADELPSNESELESMILDDDESIIKLVNKIKNLNPENKVTYFNFVSFFVFGVPSSMFR